MNASTIWKNCLDGIIKQLSPQHFATWFKPIKVLGSSEGQIELEVPNKFFLEWIKEHYHALILDTLKRVAAADISVLWKVSSDAPPMPEAERPKAAPRLVSTKKTAADNGLNSKYTFDNFIVGRTNEFAHAACVAVSKHPGSKYNPLFIYGGVGLGKTHLLQSIGNRFSEQNASLTVSYYTSERFMNEFINYVTKHKMDEFRKKFRNVDVLLIDDIQFWGGKDRTQEEFFHTFNALYESHKQIVLTSDKPPKEIEGMEERLRSRFEWGLIADIKAPDNETKVAILKNKANQEGVIMPDDAAHWLASVCGSNVRELEGYLNRVVAVTSLGGQEININSCKEALKDLTKNARPKTITIEEIQKAASEVFEIKTSDMKSKRRHKNIALPRQVAMFVARNYGKFSYPEIGHAFGGKDHSTAIHAVKKIEKTLETSLELKEKVQKLINRLGVD